MTRFSHSPQRFFMSLIRILLSVLSLLVGHSLGAQTLSFKSIEEVEARGHFGLDPLNLFLLYELNTRRNFDPTSVVQSVDPQTPGPMSDTLAQWRASTDPFAKMELQAQIRADFSLRRQTLQRSAQYWIPLVTRQETISSGNVVSFQVTLDLYGNSGARHKQCVSSSPDGGQRIRSCVSVEPSLLDNDLFKRIPVNSPESAKALRDLLRQGQWRLIALVRPAGPYALLSPSEGGQALEVFGLALVNPQNGMVVNSTAVNPSTLGPQQPGQPTAKASPPPSVDPLPATRTDPLTTDQPRPAEPDAEITQDEGEIRIIPPKPLSKAEADLDKLLALLSMTVYTSADQLHLVERERQALLKKHARITQDSRRMGVTQSVEMNQLSDQIQLLGRKRQSLEQHLKLKEVTPSRWGAMAVNAKEVPGLVYERYRLRDGREIFVFKGTSTMADVETDLKLITSPQTISEIRQLVSQSGGVTQGVSNWVLDRVTLADDTPGLFTDADLVVHEAIERGLKPEKIIVTGHSLGGGLAQYAGMKNKVGYIATFNTAPVNERMLAQIDKAELQNHANKRHYISFIEKSSVYPLRIFDPVSKKMGLTSINTLKVIGEPRYTAVCSNAQSAEYVEFIDKAQGMITKGTFSTMAIASKYKPLETVGRVGGAVLGMSNASTDVVSSGKTASSLGKKSGTAIAAGTNCIKHPFLCAGTLAAGGVVSSLASGTLPLVWNVLSAHRMQNLYDAIVGDVPKACESYPPMPK